ncbi:tail fiber protein [Balneolaceae bacterium ANBcel3]|nr:tail fiber protein [Balneolaceae bacterium ANBcel3]
MDAPFIAMIMAWAVQWAPMGWAQCDGRMLQISQNQALFSLIATTFGGNGQTYFNLPDLRGRVPVGMGQSPGGAVFQMGQTGGAETVTLNINEMPSHQHQAQMGEISVTPVYSKNNATRTSPQANDVPAIVGVLEGRDFSAQQAYGNNTNTIEGASLTGQASVVVDPNGGSLPHENMQPYQVINWVIALNGLYPPRN